ncbi:MAG: hypothetical protein ACTSO9_14495, partial [Candidatus Helarchaeota archaeon]
MKKKKLFFSILITILLTIGSSSLFLLNKQSEQIEITNFFNNRPIDLQINAAIENVTGICNESIYNLYVNERTEINYFTDRQNHTEIYPGNVSQTNFDYNLTAAKLAISVTSLTDQQNKLIVTENTTDHMNSTNNNVTKLAQEFTIEETSHIGNFSVYLNYRCWLSLTYIKLDIYKVDDLDRERINTMDIQATMPGNKLVLTQEWINISYNNVLTPGNYYAVIYFQNVIPIVIPENNSWQVHEYNNSMYNNGSSMYNNGTHWINITNDDTRDFLMILYRSRYVDPQEVNLTCYINNESMDLVHIYNPNPGFLQFPWTSYCEYYLPAPPEEDINFTIRGDIVFGFGLIYRKIRYIKFLNTSGNYSATLDKRRWIINYTSENSSSSFLPVYIFPLDWSVNKFYRIYDNETREIIEYGIMFSKIYNQTYNGIYYPETGDGYQIFNYYADFSSPNYVKNINPQIVRSNDNLTQYTFYKGDTIRIQTIVQDTEGIAAVGGNCCVYIYDSSNNLLRSENITLINGFANSSKIDTSGWSVGNYLIIAIWTNGTEVGFSQFTFMIQEKPIFFFPPPEQEPVIWYILATVGAVLAAVVGGMIVRRKFQERHWEKSLLHLFVMTKDGRSMYDYSFGIEEKDPTLISGMLTAMSNFVKETMGSKKHLKSIDQQDKKVIL